MGTSNWQNISYNIEILMKIAPERVLDVGVGFGRWGMIVREFCDVWFGRVMKSDWKVHIEGIEAFKENISEYHYAFYDHIHIGDAREVIFSLGNSWDVVIFGDVLEHFEREVAERILNWCLENSSYIMINIPLGSDWSQSDSYENPYERHLSTWTEEDFENSYLIRKAHFLDFAGRPFGVFVLSKSDPKGLRESLFSVAGALVLLEGFNEENSDAVYAQALSQRNEQLVNELNAIKNSRGYQFIEYLRQSRGRELFLRLAHMIIPKQESLQPIQKTTQKADSLFTTTSGSPVTKLRDDVVTWKPEDQAWLERQISQPKPVSINHPEWRGILASSKELFEEIFFIPDELNEQNAIYYASLFLEAQLPSITIQGFPHTYYHLVKALKRIAPSMPIYIIWHGNFLQMKEDYAWSSFELAKSLLEENDIQKIGFVKKGMAEIIKSAGLPAHFIMNFVRRIPAGPSKCASGGVHIGVWAEPDNGWRKPPYAMLAALELIPNAIAQVVNVSPRAKNFGEWFELDAVHYTHPLSHDKAIDLLSTMHLNMYVTLSECAPMLPLESLSVGSPCLFGPTSHYFLDHEYLHEHLVVPYPDHAEVIAEKANLVLSERDRVIEAYRKYAPEYNQRALKILSEFLEHPMQ